MTRKSASRVQRDLQKKNHEQKKKKANDALKENCCWDELNEMYYAMRNLLSQHAHLSELAKNQDLIAAVPDKITLAANIRILANDLKVLSDELGEIHNTHINKSGGTTDPDEFMGTISIFEQYNLFMERHQAVVMPTALHIIEQFQQAENIILAASRVDSNLTEYTGVPDENGIIDVEVISTTPYNSEDKVVGIELGTGEKVIVDKPDFNKLTNSFNSIHTQNSAD